MKKMISLLLVCCLLAVMLPAASVKATADSPSVEDILSDYHAKAFTAQCSGGSSAASTCSRGGDSMTLEQQTVQTLTEAGYEAYNVTAENYDSLEESLNTDFSGMGLAPNSSYIIVISGEEASNENDGIAPAGNDIILPPHVKDDDDAPGSSFTYIEDGVTYTMRYVTLTSADALSELFKEENFVLSTSINWAQNCINFAEMAYSVATEFVDDLPIICTFCSVASLLGDAYNAITYDPMTILNADDVAVWSATAWTRNYIQVKDSETNQWHTAQCSSYAVTRAELNGPYVYDSETNAPVKIGDVELRKTTYSPLYSNYSERKARAVMGYNAGAKLHDGTGDIHFYFTSNGKVISFSGDEGALFVHEESDAYLLPLIQDT